MAEIPAAGRRYLSTSFGEIRDDNPPFAGPLTLLSSPGVANAGGSLPLAAETTPASQGVAAPPPPPRSVPLPDCGTHPVHRLAWPSPAWSFCCWELTFGTMGAVLTVSVVTAPVGLPFAGEWGQHLWSWRRPDLVWRVQVARRNSQNSGTGGGDHGRGREGPAAGLDAGEPSSALDGGRWLSGEWKQIQRQDDHRKPARTGPAAGDTGVCLVSGG